jgi:hypothetical protein
MGNYQNNLGDQLVAFLSLSEDVFDESSTLFCAYGGIYDSQTFVQVYLKLA